MLAPLFLLLLVLPQEKPAEPRPPAPAAETAPPPQSPAPLAPLGFGSRRLPFQWDQQLPVGLEVDGLRVNTVFFNNREIKSGWLKDANFGTRAQLEVTNTAKADRVPGFAVAVFDKEGQLLGVASGGTKIGVVKPGQTETFDLNFTQVKERLPRGDHFVLAVELR
ncbi:MAG: hypothetical protein HY823_13115 [Acidobacteria bacterium]|nr:hypothetical protein [Acidobacteriota bacterium]